MDIKQGFSKQLTKINIKTSTFLEENKIKTFITTLETDINALKTKAGELGYQMWTGEADTSEQMEAVYNEITAKYETIKEQELLMVELTERSKQVLGSEIPGAAAAGERIFCPNCGGNFPATSKFCQKCGTKLQ